MGVRIIKMSKSIKKIGARPFHWAVVMIILLGLTSACTPNTGEVVPTSEATASQISAGALSTSLPTIGAENAKMLSETIVQSESATPPSTSLPTITPIPTTLATETPTDIPPSPTIELTATNAPTTSEPEPTKSPPLPTPSGNYSWTLKVPILMYHYISIPPDDANKYRKDLSVAPQDFRQQMEYLAKNGYETIDLYDLSLAITNKKDLPEKPVIITLDDGYRDNYTNAFPILQEYGLKATFFIVTEFIDKNLGNYMTWDMVKEMSASGMQIESHSKTHPDLSVNEKEHVIYEVLGSMETIEAHTGKRSRFFCYPGGRYNETTIEVVNELDFWGAVTTASGKWHNYNDRYEWSRLRVRNTTALPEFIDMIDPGNSVSGKNVDG